VEGAAAGEVLLELLALYYPRAVVQGLAPGRALVYSVATACVACDIQQWRQHGEQGPLASRLLGGASCLSRALQLLGAAAGSSSGRQEEGRRQRQHLQHPLLPHQEAEAVLRLATSAEDALALLGSGLCRAEPAAGDAALLSGLAVDQEAQPEQQQGSWRAAALAGLPEGVAAAAAEVLLRHGAVGEAVRVVHGSKAPAAGRQGPAGPGRLPAHWRALLVGLLGAAGPRAETLQQLAARPVAAAAGAAAAGAAGADGRRTGSSSPPGAHIAALLRCTGSSYGASAAAARPSSPAAAAQQGLARASALPAALSALGHVRRMLGLRPDKAVAMSLLACLATQYPPLGAHGSPGRLLQHWQAWCGGGRMAGPAGWVALLRALWLAGDDQGQLLLPWLRAALQRPLEPSASAAGFAAAGAGAGAAAASLGAAAAAAAAPSAGQGGLMPEAARAAAARDEVLGQVLRSVVLERPEACPEARLRLLRRCLESAASLGLPFSGDYALSQATLALLLHATPQAAHASGALPALALAGLQMGATPGGRAARVLASVCGVLEGARPMAMTRGVQLALPGGPGISTPAAIAVAKGRRQQGGGGADQGEVLRETAAALRGAVTLWCGRGLRDGGRAL
jgi:hypothetical protein